MQQVRAMKDQLDRIDPSLCQRLGVVDTERDPSVTASIKVHTCGATS